MVTAVCLINFELSLSLVFTMNVPICNFLHKREVPINLMNLVDCFESDSENGRIPEMSGMTYYLKDN